MQTKNMSQIGYHNVSRSSSDLLSLTDNNKGVVYLFQNGETMFDKITLGNYDILNYLLCFSFSTCNRGSRMNVVHICNVTL